MASGKRATAYEEWMRREGLPIVEGYSLADVEALGLGPWARTGGVSACSASIVATTAGISSYPLIIRKLCSA